MAVSLQHNLDPTLKDLIESLLCDVEERLGSHGGAEEIKVRLFHGNHGHGLRTPFDSSSTPAQDWL